jgi:hypothetical protein
VSPDGTFKLPQVPILWPVSRTTIFACLPLTGIMPVAVWLTLFLLLFAPVLMLTAIMDGKFKFKSMPWFIFIDKCRLTSRSLYSLVYVPRYGWMVRLDTLRFCSKLHIPLPSYNNLFALIFIIRVILAVYPVFISLIYVSIPIALDIVAADLA